MAMNALPPARKTASCPATDLVSPVQVESVWQDSWESTALQVSTPLSMFGEFNISLILHLPWYLVLLAIITFDYL